MKTKRQDRFKRHVRLHRRLRGNGTGKSETNAPWTYRKRYKAVRMKRVRDMALAKRECVAVMKECFALLEA